MLLRACERALVDAGITREGTGRVLVACSGGADSVALLRVCLVLLGPSRVVAGHVDHAVRAGSRADAEHVRSLCAAHAVPALFERLAPPSADEATLRALRYAALERMRREAGAEVVLTGHTRDDQAETVLLRLLRVAGPERLTGMPARRGRVLRPLLEVPRAEVRAYARKKRWPFRDDPTNAEPAYLRNRVRKELLPLLEARYGRGIAGRLAALARAASRSADVARSAGAARRPREAERPARPPPPRTPDFFPRVDGYEGIERGLQLARAPWGPLERAGAGAPGRAEFDAALVPRVRVRTFRAGDRVEPFGLGGRRKVSDVLGEAGVPVELRGRWPVLVDDEDRVLWVAGLLRSRAAPVTSATREVWVASVDLGAGR
jgi:tRNA(Ile)-lysidine synthase